MDVVRHVTHFIALEIYDLIKLIRNFLFTDSPRCWARSFFVIQRSLGVALLGGMAAIFSGIGVSVGNVVNATRAFGATSATL